MLSCSTISMLLTTSSVIRDRNSGFKQICNAPRGKVIEIDTTNPARNNWKVVVPESKETLQSVSFVNNRFILNYLKDAYTQVKIYETSGKLVSEVAFPGIGSASGFGGKATDKETFYAFTGFTTPTTIYRYDMVTGKSTIFRQPKVDFNPADFETKQVFYTSKDGTKVPMFITHKKGLKLNGNNPTYLYGYGGFNISLSPAFSVGNLVWMEMGGVYAQPNLRGGGEYGEDWHQAGMKLKKQNVFDDFIAAAEWLIANKYTSTPKLAIGGGSNGGLLVGAAMTQRPDLFGAALPAVGVMDMLRFQKFTIGWAWVSDYGSSDNRGRVQSAVRILAVAQHQAGNFISADDDHHSGSRRSRLARTQLQIRRGTSSGAGRRRADPDSH